MGGKSAHIMALTNGGGVSGGPTADDADFCLERSGHGGCCGKGADFLRVRQREGSSGSSGGSGSSCGHAAEKLSRGGLHGLSYGVQER